MQHKFATILYMKLLFIVSLFILTCTAHVVHAAEIGYWDIKFKISSLTRSSVLLAGEFLQFDIYSYQVGGMFISTDDDLDYQCSIEVDYTHLPITISEYHITVKINIPNDLTVLGSYETTFRLSIKDVSNENITNNLFNSRVAFNSVFTNTLSNSFSSLANGWVDYN